MRMKRQLLMFLALGAIAAGFVTPERGLAASITSARPALGETHFTLHLEADAPIERTVMRSEPGLIRVWFFGLPDDVWLDPYPTAAGARRWAVRIRPGPGGSAVVMFRFFDKRTIDESRIQVLSHGSRGFVRIALDALPELSPSDKALMGSSEALLESEDTTEAAPVVEDAHSLEASDPPGDDLAAETTEDMPTPTGAKEAELPAPFVAAKKDSGEALRTRPDGSSPLVPLVLLTGLLAAVYGVVRYVLKKRARNPLDDIQIVAQKRLGNRHQIVLVRALGEDHLLSVNGQQTQRIASGRPPDMEDAGFSTPFDVSSGALDTELFPELAATPVAEPIAPAEELGLPQPVHRAPTPVAVTQASALADPAPATRAKAKSYSRKSRRPSPGTSVQGRALRSKMQELEEKNRFGAELLKLAVETEERPPPTVRPPRGHGGKSRDSEAVAGLLKLRDRLAS